MRRLAAFALALALLAGCAPQPREDGKTHILCTTYPVYLFTTAVTEGAEDVSVELMIRQKVSCLHDYTLTVADMRAVERADVIVMNGGGLEAFLDSALAQTGAAVIDCSAGIPLLPSPDGDQDEADPHFWLDPDRALSMLDNVAAGLEPLLGQDLEPALARAREAVSQSAQSWRTELAGEHLSPLITFHDGFQYFAQAFGLEQLAAIEEEEGAEASARELREMVELVRENHIPAIFVEKNGSVRSAQVIAGETGCKVYPLDMIMDGQGVGIQGYLEAMEQNLATVREALG